MKFAQIQIALNQNRPMYRVTVNGGASYIGRVTEAHNNYLLMRYIKHPEIIDLRIIVDADSIVAIEEL